MQDEINEKTVALYIKTGKLTAEVLQKAIKKLGILANIANTELRKYILEKCCLRV